MLVHPRSHEAKEQERRRIRGVEVFEDQDHRLVLGGFVQETADGVEEVEAGRLR
ncbi:MAG TPA: hypothetical protein VHG90_07695 [Acidimicrobiales bacterium]|nr:hypothetical protein [Acidimicrobiales bacterium]